MKIGIMGAMTEEVGSLKEQMTDIHEEEHGRRVYIQGKISHIDVVVVFSGWGKVASATTATVLIERYGVNKIIFTGVAGAVSSNLNIGDIVISEQLYQHDMDGRPIMPAKHEIPLTGITFFKADQGLIKKAEAATDGLFHSLSTKIPATSLERFGIKAPKFIHGTIATGDEFVYSQKRTKAILAERPETNAVEMEGAAVAQVCSNYKVPFVVIRTISDKADHTSAIDFPAFINEIARHYSEHIVVSMLRAYSLMKKAAAIIKKLNLLPHPEGGYYREIHRATLKIDCTQTHGGKRSAYTSIYFLLLDNDFSAWHKVASDETWLFHSGQDLNIYSIEKDGTIKTQILGATNGVFQLTIPANTWFAAEINVNDKNDAYSLVSCTVAPGFDFKDFELARKENLVADFGTTPEKIHLLERLSKKDHVNHYAPRARL